MGPEKRGVTKKSAAGADSSAEEETGVRLGDRSASGAEATKDINKELARKKKNRERERAKALQDAREHAEEHSSRVACIDLQYQTSVNEAHAAFAAMEASIYTEMQRYLTASIRDVAAVKLSFKHITQYLEKSNGKARQAEMNEAFTRFLALTKKQTELLEKIKAKNAAIEEGPT